MLEKSEVGGYKIKYLPKGTKPSEILKQIPIPGQARVVILADKFPSLALRLKEEGIGLGGKVAVSLATFFEDSVNSLAVIAWKKVRADNLGSRFVKMEGLEKDLFELETLPARFLLEALTSGAQFTRPKRSTSEWDRNIDITILNYFGKDEGSNALSRGFSQDEIGEIYKGDGKKLTRARIGQIVIKVIEQLHSNLPDYLQHKYLLKDLLEQISRPKFMLRKADMAGRAVAEAVLKGAATYQDLINLGFTAGFLSNSRRILPEYGLPVADYVFESKLLIADLKAVKASDLADKKQQVLDKINRNFQNHYFVEYQNFCLTIFDLASSAGLHPVAQWGEKSLIVKALSKAGIVYRQITSEVKSGKQKGARSTYVILAVDRDQAIQVLQNDPTLEALRREVVWQISGEKMDKLPTTGDLANKKEYLRLGNLLLAKLGLPRINRRSKIIIQQWLDECSVAVFVGKNGHFSYHIDQEDQLAAFLQEKYKQLRNLNPH